jgi:hypothetical protein
VGRKPLTTHSIDFHVVMVPVPKPRAASQHKNEDTNCSNEHELSIDIAKNGLVLLKVADILG